MTEILYLTGAGLSALLTALAGYLTSPHQQLLSNCWPARRLLLIAGMGLMATLFCLMQVMGKATAVFLLLTVLMLLWSTVPLLIVYLKHHRRVLHD